MSSINKINAKISELEHSARYDFMQELDKFISSYEYGGDDNKSIDGVPLLPEKFAKLIEPDLSGNCRIFSELIKLNKKASERSHYTYHYGAIINLLATIAAGRIWIPKGQRGLTTDFYILQYGQSSVWSKSGALVIPKEILEQLELSFLLLPEKLTVSRLFHEMKPKSMLDMSDNLDNPEGFRIEKETNKFAGQRSLILDEFGKKLRSMTNENSISYEWAQVLLEFCDGNSTITYSTMKDGTRIIQNPHLNLIGNATPPNFKNLSSDKVDTLKSDGLLPRFLVACPPPDEIPTGGMWGDPIKVPEQIIDYLKRWHESLGVPEKDVFDKQPPVKRTTLKIDTDVIELHNAYDKWLFDVRLKDFPDWKPAYTRHSNKVLKIAGLMASLNGKTLITMNEYLYALQIGEVYRTCIHLFYDALNNPERTNKFQERENAIMEKLVSYQQKGKLPIAQSTLEQKLPAKLFKSLSKTEVFGIFRDMERVGLIIYETRSSINLSKN